MTSGKGQPDIRCPPGHSLAAFGIFSATSVTRTPERGQNLINGTQYGQPFLVVAIAFLVMVPVVVPGVPARADFSQRSYTEALDIIQSSLAAHGELPDVEQVGGLTISTEGVFDLGVRLQGRSPVRPEPTPIEESISIDLAGNRLAYDVTWSNYKYSQQELREIYDAEGRVLYIDKRAGSGGWPPFAPVADAKERYKRLLPQFLLADALANRATLRRLGHYRSDGHSVDAVGYVTPAGDYLTLHIDQRTRLLRSAAFLFDMELQGDTEMSWVWDGYERRAGLLIPTRLRVLVDGKLLKDVQVSVRPGVDKAVFAAPEGIAVSEPPATESLISFQDLTPYSQRPGEARELAPGVFLVPGLRPGFHMFFVEFDEFSLAIDAPTGWYEMNQLPPSNFVGNEASSELAEKYIRIIKKTIPDKPIRYVALTHHHSDHIE
jgi:hypothetical protein